MNVIIDLAGVIVVVTVVCYGLYHLFMTTKQKDFVVLDKVTIVEVPEPKSEVKWTPLPNMADPTVGESPPVTVPVSTVGETSNVVA